MDKRLRILLLILMPSILLYVAWPPRVLWFLAFVAFVPFFELERELKGWRYFAAIYSGLFLFNVSNTWWVWYASAGGAVFMLFANSLLMCLPFLAYRMAKKSFGQGRALFAFVCFWLSFEYLHLNWEITWPWLSLGNVFARFPEVVQWYEYTGMLGGSLWVLVANVLAYSWWENKSKTGLIKLSTLISVPILISILILWIGQKSEAKTKAVVFEAVIIQPNVDPYLKFQEGKEVANLEEMLALADSFVSDKTAYVICPETAVVEYVDEDQMGRFASVNLLKAFVRKHPSIHLITGVSTYNFYDEGEQKKPTARQSYSGEYYESYNTAMELNLKGEHRFYHKSKLVPGVEKMPYPRIFGFLEKLSIDMGGVSGSLGQDDSATVFRAGDKPDLAPLICYESVFPGFVGRFVQKGADIILVMTNDGWWRDTDGYKQHMHYARLRAIENRKEVLRSANTGISCHIDQWGQILERTNWWEKDVLKVNVQAHEHSTFFSKHGDYIGRFGSFFGVFLFLGAWVKRKVKHRI